jgi:hypothetical protein
MYDLTDEEEPAVGEVGARLIGIVNGAVDAVAEPERISEADGDPGIPFTKRQLVTGSANALDEVTVVFGLDDRRNLAGQTEAAPKVGGSERGSWLLHRAEVWLLSQLAFRKGNGGRRRGQPCGHPHTRSATERWLLIEAV